MVTEQITQTVLEELDRIKRKPESSRTPAEQKIFNAYKKMEAKGFDFCKDQAKTKTKEAAIKAAPLIAFAAFAIFLITRK